MKPRKPDRVERMVRQIVKSDEDVGYDAFCFPNDVIKLLRKEHKWMRRMVKSISQDYESTVGDTAAEMLRDEILARLAQRRK